jgi:8-oxo-dGTP pyrophosphatase MutT (NUDIX family)
MSVEIQKVEKAKVAIVNSRGEILTLRRSQEEETRRGEWDWAGGTLDEGETNLRKALLREVEVEELPGTKLHNIRPLDVKSKIEDGAFKVSYLLAATATFPPDGISLSFEHDDYAWIPRVEYPGLTIPKKYRNAVVLGAPIFEELVQLTQNLSQPELVTA